VWELVPDVVDGIESVPVPFATSAVLLAELVARVTGAPSSVARWAWM
jgi:hypothetical protein